MKLPMMPKLSTNCFCSDNVSSVSLSIVDGYYEFTIEKYKTKNTKASSHTILLDEAELSSIRELIECFEKLVELDESGQ